MENIKLQWWDGFLRNNLHKTKEGKIALTSFDGKIAEFNSIHQVYTDFITANNEIIWEPYYNVFTKIFTEWVVETIIKACNEIPLKDRINFIKKSIIQIDKEQTFEEYTKFKLNEHLTYYKSVLHYSFSDLYNPVYENEKVFTVLTENERINDLRENLLHKQFDKFFNILRAIYSSIPYQISAREEAYFHSIFHVILFLISATTKSEEATNNGRIDSSIELGNSIFIFEFKLKEADLAIKQIKEKKYYEKYQQPDKEIFLIGVSFDPEIKNIKSWKTDKI